MSDPEIPDAQDLHDTLSAAFDAPSSEPAADTVEPPVTAEPDPLAGKTESQEQLRGPDGKFLAKAGEEVVTAKPDIAKDTEQKPAAQVADLQPKSDATPLPVSAAPPPGWSIAAKAAWDKADPALREAVAKRETEISIGLAKLADYKGLDDHVSLAKQHGTTIKDALDRYIGLERGLRSDPINGVLSICRDIGLDPQQLIASITKSPGDQKPGENGAQPQPRQTDPEVLALKQELNSFKQAIAGQQQSAVQSELAAFAAKPEHRYFENVRVVMAALMQSGAAADLEKAYEMACWANPEIQATLISERAQRDREKAEREQAEAASKARQAARSVNGSPGGIVPGVPERGLREEISANFD